MAMADTPPGSLLLSQLMKNGNDAQDGSDRDIAVNGTCLKMTNPRGCSRLLRIVQPNSMLTEIDLAGCNLDRCDELAEMIQTAQHLKRLLLEWNNLGLARTGISSFCSAVALSPTLKELDMRSNRIGPSFAASLANALRSSRSLGYIDLRWNAIGPTGAGAFISLLQKNPVLTALQLAGNGIPQKLLAQIDAFIESNRTSTVFPQCRPHITHPLEEQDSKTVNRDGLEAIYSGKLAALEEELTNLMAQVESLKKEKDALRLDKLATENELKAVRVELAEEAVLRKYVDKKAQDLEAELLLAKQDLACSQEKLSHEINRVALQNASVLELQDREKALKDTSGKATTECNELKAEIARLHLLHTAELESLREKAGVESQSHQQTVQRLQSEIDSVNRSLATQVDKLRESFAADLKLVEADKEAAREEYERGCSRIKSAATAAEEQFMARERALKEDKENIESMLNARVLTVKSEVEKLQAELDSMQRELAKVKKKHMVEIEEYVTSIAQKKAAQHRLELSKSDLEEKILALTTEKAQLQEKVKLWDDREKLLDKKLELEKLKYSEQASIQASRHVEEKRALEAELQASRKLIENTQKHLQELQIEQERRKVDVERKFMGVEATFIDCIRQQFAGLRAANSTQQPPLLVGEF